MGHVSKALQFLSIIPNDVEEMDDALDEHPVGLTAPAMFERGKISGRDADRLRRRDLHVVHVAPVPQRLEDAVAEPHHHDVLDGLLAEEMVGESGLIDRKVDGQVWRIFSTQGQEKDVWIHVAELGKYRQDILYAGLESAIVPLLFVFPLMALFIWWSIRVSLGPLRHLSQEIGLRKASSLQALEEEKAVKEVQPLVQALNQLFKRVEVQMASERQFTSDAAHELRTPVAAIRMQAQVAMGATAADVQKQALQALMDGCDRATRLISQLLELSRLDAAERYEDTLSQQAVDVIALTRQQLAESGHAWIAKQQTLDFDAPEKLWLYVNPEWLTIVVRNLIDNASRYSPLGAHLQVTWQDGPEPMLTVEDSGPGMTASDRVRLGDRFFRVLGTEATGSGLGWSIVRKIAQLTRVKVQLGTSPHLGGLQVVMVWPKDRKVVS